MKRVLVIALFSGLALAKSVAALDTEPPKESHDVVKATYVLTGLHCQGCVKTIESSLSHATGIESVTVDWKAKDAHIEFDESIISAQKVARLIADTPHMMGKNMHYEGLLALNVSEVENDASAKSATDVLRKIEGVKRATALPKQHTVEVQFDAKGRVTEAQLLSALKDAGFHAKNL